MQVQVIVLQTYTKYEAVIYSMQKNFSENTCVKKHTRHACFLCKFKSRHQATCPIAQSIVKCDLVRLS